MESGIRVDMQIDFIDDYNDTKISCHLYKSVWCEGGCLDSIIQRDI